MSFYYEQKGCCGRKKEDHKKEDHKKEEKHELDCFCGKYLKNFLGDDVELTVVGQTATIDGTIACIDEKSGVVTVAGLEGLTYVCCKFIIAVTPATA